jgi:regulator of protease activity HflC (stomatin/prohibitin superfamily)
MFFVIIDIHVVRGNELGIKETWYSGIIDEPLPAKTYVLFPGFSQRVYNYYMGPQNFVMNDKDMSKETASAEGLERDAYVVQSADQQDIHISLNVTWRLNPAKLAQIHRTFRENITDVVLRPNLLRVVKNQATLLKAVEAYSGEGLVKLQKDIELDLQKEDGDLFKNGILIENFVIEGITLDPEYTKEIKARQVAMQREQRAAQEEKAAMAESLKARAEAQKDYETSLVKAKTEKETGILEAEKQAEMLVLKAEADKKQKVLEAEATKETGELKAASILALGQAEAESKKLMLSAYAVPGSESFVQIEVSKNMADAFKNIQGYLPSDMKVNILSESFMKSVQSLMAPKAVPVETK